MIEGYFLENFDFKVREEKVGSLHLSFAEIGPPQVLELSEQLITSREILAEEPIDAIVDWIDQTASRWCDPSDSVREEAASIIPRIGGMSREMLELTLSDLFQQLRRPTLIKLLEEALGDPLRIDQFCPNPNGIGYSRAFGPPLITQISPGNIPGLSVNGLVFGLLMKSASLIRASKESTLLPVLFAKSLKETRPDLANNVAILHWDRSEAAMTKVAFQKSEAVVVYGNDDTITHLRGLIPTRCRTLFYGHKLSLGLIGRESICRNIAEKAAYDVALFDQRGCLSPQLFYVESGGATSGPIFAQWIADALEVISEQVPKSDLSPHEAAQIQQLRAALPLKGGRVYSSPKGLDWTVLYDPDPTFSISPLSRTIWIKPVDDLSHVLPLITPYQHLLQAIGLALSETRQDDLIPRIARLGGCRICEIGQMQRPPLTWHHEGQSPLRPLLRFVDWETESLQGV